MRCSNGVVFGVLVLVPALALASVATAEPTDPTPSDPASTVPSGPPPVRNDFGRPGFYLVGGGATGIELNASDVLNEAFMFPGLVSIDTALGFNVRGGARSNRWFASELQLEYLTFTAKVLGIEALDTRVITLTPNLLFYLTRSRIHPICSSAPAAPSPGSKPSMAPPGRSRRGRSGAAGDSTST